MELSLSFKLGFLLDLQNGLGFAELHLELTQLLVELVVSFIQGVHLRPLFFELVILLLQVDLNRLKLLQQGFVIFLHLELFVQLVLQLVADVFVFLLQHLVLRSVVLELCEFVFQGLDLDLVLLVLALGLAQLKREVLDLRLESLVFLLEQLGEVFVLLGLLLEADLLLNLVFELELDLLQRLLDDHLLLVLLQP